MIENLNEKQIRLFAEQTLKADEEIISTNATVIVDKQGNISWVDNEMLCLMMEE